MKQSWIAGGWLIALVASAGPALWVAADRIQRNPLGKYVDPVTGAWTVELYWGFVRWWLRSPFPPACSRSRACTSIDRRSEPDSLELKHSCAYLRAMAIREILEVPDPRLKTVSKPVEAFDGELKTLVADMFETMYDAPGIGLAAIQVGVPLRVLVIDLQPDDEDAEPEVCNHGGHEHTHQPTKREPRVFVNPEILDPAEEQATYQEGCLSVPEIFADVDRPATCRVRWQDLEGERHEEQMEGLMATCIQHEMDHLEGILFIDHLSRLKRQMALKKLEKLRKAA